MKRNKNGNGSITRRKDTGRLEGKYRINGDRKSLYQKKGESDTAFQKRFNEFIVSLEKGSYIEKSKVRHIDILKEYVEQQYKTNEVNAGTYGRNLNTIKVVEKLCDNFTNKPIQKITENDILKALPRLTTYSNNTINKIYRYIKKPFEIAISRRIIIYNPINSMLIKKPKSDIEDKKIEALSFEEQNKLEKIVKEENSKYKNVVLLQLETGMRIGEVLALKYENIDWKERKIHIKNSLTRDENGKDILGKKTKTKKSQRDIPITPIIEKILRDEQTKITNINGMLFFDNERNTIFTPIGVNSYLKSRNKKHQIAKHIHTHMLRHSYATRCFEAGMSIKTVQELLGHENIDITMNVYVSLMGDYKETEMQKYLEYKNSKIV